MGGIPELLEEKNKRGPVAPSSSSPFLFFPPCMERNENISRGAPGSFLFFFLSLATGQTVVSHPSSLFLLRILLLFILVFSLSLFKCSFTPRGNHFERTSKEEEEEKLCYFSSFPFFSSDLLLFPLLTTPIRLGPISLSAPPFTNKKFDFISKINERRIAREI